MPFSFALSECEICTKKAADWENVWSSWNVALLPSTAVPGKHRQINEQTWPRAQRGGREVYFCLRMVKSKSGTILGFNWEGIGEPRKRGMECEDSRSDGEVSDSQAAIIVHLVEEESHTVGCPEQQTPLGRSDFLMFILIFKRKLNQDGAEEASIQKVLWQKSLADKTVFFILKCTCVRH